MRITIFIFAILWATSASAWIFDVRNSKGKIIHVIASNHGMTKNSPKLKSAIEDLIGKSNGYIVFENLVSLTSPLRKKISDEFGGVNRNMTVTEICRLKMPTIAESVLFGLLIQDRKNAKFGGSSSNSLDSFAKNVAVKQQRTLKELEGGSGLRQFLNSWSQAEAQEFITRMCSNLNIDESVIFEQYVTAMEAAYVECRLDDVQKISVTRLSQIDEKLIEKFYKNRNNYMAKKLISFSNDSPNSIIFIGAAHIAGHDGIISTMGSEYTWNLRRDLVENLECTL